jgi:hypothetical protein
VAVKHTGVPEQTVSDGAAETVMLTGRTGFTIMAIPLDVAGFPVGQMALEVITQDIISPFTGL